MKGLSLSLFRLVFGVCVPSSSFKTKMLRQDGFRATSEGTVDPRVRPLCLPGRFVARQVPSNLRPRIARMSSPYGRYRSSSRGGLLPHFLEQIDEIMQAADRCALPVLRDRRIFACRAQQNGVLHLKEWNTSAKERYRQFLIRCRKTTVDTAALE